MHTHLIRVNHTRRNKRETVNFYIHREKEAKIFFLIHIQRCNRNLEIHLIRFIKIKRTLYLI